MTRSSPTRDRLSLGARVLVFVSLALLGAGCNSRGEVSGKVVFHGKPLPGGAVTFYTPKGVLSTQISEDGSYSLSGIPTGTSKITVATAPPRGMRVSPRMQPMLKDIKSGKIQLSPEEKEKLPPAMKSALEEPPPAQGNYVPLPAKYGDPEQSGLACTVTGGSQTHNIELN